MSEEIVSGIIMRLLLMGVVASVLFPLRIEAQFEEWVPCIPDARYVELDYQQENSTSYMNVSIMFPSSGYNVSDWGTPTVVGNNMSVNAEIWDWTGVDLQVITYKFHTYSLGDLPVGEYLFIFKVWESAVKNTTFTEYPSLNTDLNNDGKVDMKDIAYAALAFGSYPRHDRWNSRADINNDGKVDMKDIGTVAKEFGKTS